MKNERIQINEHAYFDTYILHASQEYNVGKKKPLLIVCPGGGYAFTSDREAEPIALKFNGEGLHSIVLWYTTEDLVPCVPHNALKELAQTVAYARAHAQEWLIDEEQIIVCGFSAGGNLALQMAVHSEDEQLAQELGVQKEDIKVNLAILGYPASLMTPFPKGEIGFGERLLKQPQSANMRFFGMEEPDEAAISKVDALRYIGEHTPPMFIWHTFEDQLVDVQHAITLAQKLKEHDIPFELHIFEKGEHGLALCDRTTARKKSHHNSHVIHWFALCMEWLSPYIDKEEER